MWSLTHHCYACFHKCIFMYCMKMYLSSEVRMRLWSKCVSVQTFLCGKLSHWSEKIWILLSLSVTKAYGKTWFSRAGDSYKHTSHDPLIRTDILMRHDDDLLMKVCESVISILWKSQTGEGLLRIWWNALFCFGVALGLLLR